MDGNPGPKLPSFVDRVVDFQDGISYELLKTLATYRSCQDGTPFEARMVFTCKQTSGSALASEEFVMKIKVQYHRHDAPFGTLE